MIAPDASAVDEAVAEVLKGDAELAALCPDGVFFDVAPPNAERFVGIVFVSHEEERLLGAIAFETFTYDIEAVTKGPDGTTVRAAGIRIRELVTRENLAIPDRDVMFVGPVDRPRATDVDEVNDVRWQRRGWRLAVMVQPIAN